MWCPKLVPPVAHADGNDGELGKNDGAANCRGNLLGALDAKTDMTAVVAHGNKRLEPCPLTSSGLLLNGHDFEDFVFERRTEKMVHDLRLFDWH